MKRRLLAAALATTLLLGELPLRAEGLPDLGESSQGDFSPQTERKVGESVFNDIRAREPSYLDDPEVAAYLNRIGHKLVAQADNGGMSFEFFVLKDPMLNAFALPGGYIGVHTALILAAQSESELAGVLAHEISHVTQHHMARMLAKSSQGQAAALVAMAVAILASRSNSDAAVGAIVAGQAGAIQNQLNFSRDFEREADRFGLQVLERAGYDIRGMASFFERLQKFGRLYENNAPGYLRTHPLTTERIADMENRIEGRPYKQVPDSTEFLLVRAKLRAQLATPREAVTDFETLLKQGKYGSESATRYGLAQARLRARDFAGAERELGALRRLKLESPMVETLAADLRRKQGDADGAVRLLRAARARYPEERAVAYALIDTLQEAGRNAEALTVATEDLVTYPSDPRMHALQAKSYASLGQRAQQHRAQGEAYALQGQVAEAILQFELAQKAGDGDYYALAQVDARLRELKRKRADELRETKRQQLD